MPKLKGYPTGFSDPRSATGLGRMYQEHSRLYNELPEDLKDLNAFINEVGLMPTDRQFVVVSWGGTYIWCHKDWVRTLHSDPASVPEGATRAAQHPDGYIDHL